MCLIPFIPSLTMLYNNSDLGSLKKTNSAQLTQTGTKVWVFNPHTINGPLFSCLSNILLGKSVSSIYLSCSHCLCAAEDKHCSSQDGTSISLSVAYGVAFEHERCFHLEFQKVKVFQLSKSHQFNQQRSALWRQLQVQQENLSDTYYTCESL